MNHLDEIIRRKRLEIGNCRHHTLMGDLRNEALRRPDPPPFAASLREAPLGLIAEVKHKSPSAGVIRDPFDPAAIARDYEAAGANAISVLVDGGGFGGGEEHFRAVREAVKLPLLYKEFVVDPWQIWHARLLGASAVLLIAGGISEALLRGLVLEAELAGLEVLFEVHDAHEMEMAKRLDAKIIGVNNRNLKTLETRLETSLELLPDVPEDSLAVGESGIRSHEDAERVREAGARAILVGEHLLRQPDLQTAVRDLMGS